MARFFISDFIYKGRISVVPLEYTLSSSRFLDVVLFYAYVQLVEIIDYLTLCGYLKKTTDSFPVVKLTQTSRSVLQPDAKIFMKITEIEKSSKTAFVTKSNKCKTDVQVDNNLLTALKNLRLTIAKKQNLPAFVIFHDSTLTDMCAKQPTTLDEFMNISGVGSVKAERYGEQLWKLYASI
ncbi:MAG: HRDC domain-containing protein [Treponema sp.]|nr:HRDC domain-containing protein [Treponema sp.]